MKTSATPSATAPESLLAPSPPPSANASGAGAGNSAATSPSSTQSCFLPQWNRAENSFWDTLQESHAAEDQSLERLFRNLETRIKTRLDALCAERRAAAEALHKIDINCSREQSRLGDLRNEYSRRTRKARDSRVVHIRRMEAWFAENRNGAKPPSLLVPPSPPTPVSASLLPLPQAVSPLPPPPPLPAAPSRPLSPADLAAHFALRPPSRGTYTNLTNAEICDFHGVVVGAIKKVNASNPWIDALMGLPVVRRVRLRPAAAAANRPVTPANVETVYQPDDFRCSKWIASMIAATGRVRHPRRCFVCSGGGGPFEDCVVVDGDLFPHCANCEWGRAPCRDEPVGGPGTDRPGLCPAPVATAPAPGAGVGAVVVGNHASKNIVADNNGTNFGNNLNAINNVHDMHNIKSIHNTPNTKNHDRGSPADDPSDSSDLVEITAENLVVKHDGSVYIEPECMRGVPVEKVYPGHPYWDDGWAEVAELITPHHERWKLKHEEALGSDSPAHAKFQLGRQVKRGDTILQFHHKGDFSPYQLLAKPFMFSGKGDITSYDTLFRLASTVEELHNFKVDVRPVDWVRHRLHELLTAEGDRFNLARTMHDFYNDPKLVALRCKSGFRNIGRPSSLRTRGGGGDGGGDVTGPPPAKRRRTPLNTPRNTPPGTPAALAAAVAAAHAIHLGLPLRPQPPPVGGGPVALPGGGAVGPTRTSVKPEHPDASPLGALSVTMNSSPAVLDEASPDTLDAPAAADDDDDGNATDTDSFCGDPVGATDFRVLELRHRTMTTTGDGSQYWHFFDDDDDQALDLQVLKDVGPARWGVYRPPINFGVSLGEIREVQWTPGLDKVLVDVDAERCVRFRDGARGDLAVQFKRPRTLRRFLRFLRARGIRVLAVPGDYLTHRYDAFQGDVLDKHEAGMIE